MHLSDERARSLRLSSNRATIESAGAGVLAVGRAGLSARDCCSSQSEAAMRSRQVTNAFTRGYYRAKQPLAG